MRARCLRSFLNRRAWGGHRPRRISMHDGGVEGTALRMQSRNWPRVTLDLLVPWARNGMSNGLRFKGVFLHRTYLGTFGNDFREP